MHPAGERFLSSMAAAGVRRMPAPGAGRRAAPRAAAAPAPPAAPCAGKADALSAVADEIAACTRCALHATRQRTVPGEGDPAAAIVFVGEGPGADEDRSGRPFVGRAGQLLDDIITKGMKLRRQDVYICNVVKCRPPGNRVPEPDEAATCADFLDRQLRAIAPRVICALGATAARRLLGVEQPLGTLRGEVHRWGDTPVVVTYHPAYLLRNPAAKKPTWDDIRKVLELAAAT